MGRGKNAPLEVKVVSGKLVIEIGVATLAFAALRSPWAWEMAGGKVDPSKLYRITNVEEFALDVAGELTREEEDGTTPLDTLIDSVCLKAVEEGSEWFEDIAEGKRDRRGVEP